MDAKIIVILFHFYFISGQEVNSESKSNFTVEDEILSSIDPLILKQLKDLRNNSRQTINETNAVSANPVIPVIPASPAVPAGPTNPPVNPVSAVTGTVSNVISRLPCSCFKGQCGCCSGPILASFNQRACLNVTYEPDDFAFNAAMSINDRVFYTRRISGKNPPPLCIRVPRIRIVQVCVRFHNIYFAGSNMHTCIDMAANWEDLTLFETSFDCFRIGSAGVAIVPPEEGGGISTNVDEDDDDDDEDYDDNA